MSTNDSFFALRCLVIPDVSNILSVNRLVICRACLLINRVFPLNIPYGRELLECLHQENVSSIKGRKEGEGRAGGKLLEGSREQEVGIVLIFII